MVCLAFVNNFKSVLKRGYLVEFGYTLSNAVVLFGIESLFIFGMQAGILYSRLFFMYMILVYMLYSYIMRITYKSVYKKYLVKRYGRSILVILESRYQEVLEQHIEKNYFDTFRIAGAVYLDQTPVNTRLPAVTDRENLMEYVRQNWVDEVLILSDPTDEVVKMMNSFLTMGITVHGGLYYMRERIVTRNQSFEKIGGFDAITSACNEMTWFDAVMKRLVDIIGGLVGCFLTLIIALIVGPIIYRTSPGPIIFKQERVGRNGKTFKLYKFRSMVMNADELKAKYMAQNRLASDKMFKLEWDPRIIGNKELPDGSRKTGIGEFIRKTSLDEFPQFFNVLKGDMSLVGTRPPLISEWKNYDDHHRARMAMRPGITGMWQVSGRSDITDFEEVVRLDTKYIAEWSFALDLKILVKTVLVVLKHEGSM